MPADAELAALRNDVETLQRDLSALRSAVTRVWGFRRDAVLQELSGLEPALGITLTTSQARAIVREQRVTFVPRDMENNAK